MRKLKQYFEHRAVAVLLITIVVAISVDLLRKSGLFEVYELQTYDRLLETQTRPHNYESPVVLITVNESDLQRFQYPISDAILAIALTNLEAMHPRSIGIDIFRDLQLDGREKLASVISRNRNIVLIEKILDDAIAAPAFVQSTDQIGFADLKQDIDNIIRRSILILWDSESNTHYFSLPLQVTLEFLRTENITLSPAPENADWIRLADTTLPKFASNDGGYRKADDGGYQLLMDFGFGTNPFPQYTLADIIDSKIMAEKIDGKLVLIGSTSASIQDRYEIPYSSQYTGTIYGVELQAHVADQLVRHAWGISKPLTILSEGFETFCIAIGALLGAILGSQIRSITMLFMAAVASLIIPAVTLAAIFKIGYWLPVVSPVLACFTSFGAAIIWVLVKNHSERRLIMQLFGTYVSSEVANVLWEKRDQFLEGGRPRPEKLFVTVMITDLKGYTSSMEQIDPAKIMDWINSYMSAMTRIVEEHGGIVDDYAGDGLKANFGVPVPCLDPESVKRNAINAVNCALSMAKKLSSLNQHWAALQLPTEQIRIGICTGAVIAGSIGSSKRMAYTTIGNTVNTAGRLESYQKDKFNENSEHLSRILICESTRQHLGSDFRIKCLGKQQLRGKYKPIKIYHVLHKNRDQPDNRTSIK